MILPVFFPDPLSHGNLRTYLLRLPPKRMRKVNPLRILGLDYGEKRIGVAVSDELDMTAQGVATIVRKNNKQVLEELKQVINRYRVNGSSSAILCVWTDRQEFNATRLIISAAISKPRLGCRLSYGTKPSRPRKRKASCERLKSIGKNDVKSWISWLQR